MHALKVNKDIFKKVWLYAALSFFVFFGISSVLTMLLNNAQSQILSIGGVTDISQLDTSEVGAKSTQITSILIYAIFLLVLFFVLEIYNFASFENLIWNTVYNKKTNFNNTSKFAGLMAGMIVISTVASGIMFYIASRLQGNLIKVGVMLFYLTIFFSLYAMLVSFISFGRNHKVFKAIKDAFVIGFGKLRITIVPLIIMFIAGILLNIILLLLQWIPESIYLGVIAVINTAFLAWARLYLANVLKAVKF